MNSKEIQSHSTGFRIKLLHTPQGSQQILKYFAGTHSFSNHTPQAPPADPLILHRGPQKIPTYSMKFRLTTKRRAANPDALTRNPMKYLNTPKGLRQVPHRNSANADTVLMGPKYIPTLLRGSPGIAGTISKDPVQIKAHSTMTCSKSGHSSPG